MKCTECGKEYTPEIYFFHIVQVHEREREIKLSDAIELARMVVNGEIVISPEKRLSRG